MLAAGRLAETQAKPKGIQFSEEVPTSCVAVASTPSRAATEVAKAKVAERATVRRMRKPVARQARQAAMRGTAPSETQLERSALHLPVGFAIAEASSSMELNLPTFKLHRYPS